MKEHGRLGDIGLLELLVGADEHDVCNLKSEDVVSLVKQLLGQRMVLIKVLAHADKLRPLSGKNKCFHLVLSN